MENNIRYRLRRSIKQFRLIIDNDESDLLYAGKEDDIVFADILEVSNHGVGTMKFYFPDGRVIVGKQSVRNLLELHMIGNVFDGRFNTL